MTSKRWTRLFNVVLLCSALGLQACAGGGGSGAGGGTPAPSGSSFRVLVTDAPFSSEQVLSATVSVQSLELHQAGAAEDSFVTLASFPGGKELDLAQLQNGLTATLFEGNPPPGDYDAVRIVVLPQQIVIDDGAGGELAFGFKVPSGPQTGVKVFVTPPIHVATNLTADLLLDFDLSRSFVVQGNPATPAGIKGFTFKPVVRGVNQSTAGTLTFQVRSDAGTPSVSADDVALDGATWSLTDAAGAEVAGGLTGGDPADPSVHGYAFHPGIPAGSYTLSLEAAGHEPYVFPDPVVIVAANLTDLGTVTLTRTGGLIAGSVTTRLTPLGGAAAIELPVEGAVVETGGVTASTDAAGSYQVTGLSVGLHTLTVTKAGYVTATGTGTAKAPGAAPEAVNFVLVSQLGDLTGVVTGLTGVPQGGVTVRATLEFAATTVVIAETTTDAAGSYRLSLPTGSFDISASLGAATSSSSVQIVGGSAASLDFVLP
ncbi:MAG: DUF4382 domain-containing protein [Deltaproteobacteria bacterium]|nr:DUF4382 domain-containing protein [Deltaproteobacteria bacterium]